MRVCWIDVFRAFHLGLSPQQSPLPILIPGYTEGNYPTVIPNWECQDNAEKHNAYLNSTSDENRCIIQLCSLGVYTYRTDSSETTRVQQSLELLHVAQDQVRACVATTQGQTQINQSANREGLLAIVVVLLLP